jgi:hypothetical protein
MELWNVYQRRTRTTVGTANVLCTRHLNIEVLSMFLSRETCLILLKVATSNVVAY